MKNEAKETASPPLNSILATAATAWALMLSSKEAEAGQSAVEEEHISHHMPGDVQTF